MDIYRRLEELQITLPQAPEKGGIYSQIKEFGEKLVYVSGCGPQHNGQCEFLGKVGKEVSFEQAQQAARNCMLNILAVIHSKLGDLNRIKSFVKILAFVASENSFTQQPQVVNAASKLLLDIFGEEAGSPARSAIGVNVLPGDIPVEIEVLLELK